MRGQTNTRARKRETSVAATSQTQHGQTDSSGANRRARKRETSAASQTQYGQTDSAGADAPRSGARQESPLPPPGRGASWCLLPLQPQRSCYRESAGNLTKTSLKKMFAALKFNTVTRSHAHAGLLPCVHTCATLYTRIAGSSVLTALRKLYCSTSVRVPWYVLPHMVVYVLTYVHMNVPGTRVRTYQGVLHAYGPSDVRTARTRLQCTIPYGMVRPRVRTWFYCVVLWYRTIAIHVTKVLQVYYHGTRVRTTLSQKQLYVRSTRVRTMVPVLEYVPIGTMVASTLHYKPLFVRSPP